MPTLDALSQGTVSGSWFMGSWFWFKGSWFWFRGSWFELERRRTYEPEPMNQNL
jgi:hypothetical protein